MILAPLLLQTYLTQVTNILLVRKFKKGNFLEVNTLGFVLLKLFRLYTLKKAQKCKKHTSFFVSCIKVAYTLLHIRISNLISSLKNFQETCNATFGGFISTILKSNKDYAES